MGLLEEAAQRAREGIDLAVKLDDLSAEPELREQLRASFKLLSRSKNLKQIVENEYRQRPRSVKWVMIGRPKKTSHGFAINEYPNHDLIYRVLPDYSNYCYHSKQTVITFFR